MKRREFLQGALAVTTIALLPKAAPQPPAHIPGWSWNYSEEAGRRTMEELAKGINNSIFYPHLTMSSELHISGDEGITWQPLTDDGGRFTWEASSIGFGAD